LNRSLAACNAVHVSQMVIEDTHATITAAPNAKAIAAARLQCTRQTLFGKRGASSCSYGQCGTTCLNQGAFCCGPAGTLARSPIWICDNGACITSVVGSTGVVDCYDPDNPSGTTQSCIDNVPATTCFSTDHCYTCHTDVPYCHWQTYIGDPPSPTLRWFSCISTKTVDETFFATTITNSLLDPTQGVSGGGGSSTLSNGAIAGISAGGAVFLIALVAALIWAIFHGRAVKKRRRREQEEAERQRRTLDSQPAPQMVQMQELPANARQSVYYDVHTGQWKWKEDPVESMSMPVAELPGSVKRPETEISQFGTPVRTPVRTPLVSEEEYGNPGNWPLRSPPLSR